MCWFIGETQGVVGNAKLSLPSAVMQTSFYLPDGVPGRVATIAIVGVNSIGLHPGSIDRKLIAGVVVVVRIEVNGDTIRFQSAITATQTGRNLVRLLFVTDDSKIEGLIIVDHLKNRFLCCGCAFVGVALLKAGKGRRLLPTSVVKNPVN